MNWMMRQAILVRPYQSVRRSAGVCGDHGKQHLRGLPQCGDGSALAAAQGLT